jgi:hypothetical protein
MSEPDNDIIVLENLEKAILKRPREGGCVCACWNNTYKCADENCEVCNGTGKILGIETSTLIEASIDLSGQLIDDDEPFLYIYTYHGDVRVGDCVVMKGETYVVVSVSRGKTVAGQDVMICGLDYADINNNVVSDIKRYK